MSSVEELLRGLPSVDRLAGEITSADPSIGQSDAIAAARAVITHRRLELLSGDGPAERDLVEAAKRYLLPTPRRVLNATGVIVHTNLGRAPLAESAVQAAAQAARGYLDLEYDMASGQRGHRDAHVTQLLTELTGAEDATVVNNGAAAVLLAAASLAPTSEHRIIVSRGQLVEIGGGFRIPDVVAQAGAQLVEVGTTNRTRLADYQQAIQNLDSDVILRVHQSNFRTVGFTEDVSIEQLTTLHVPVIDDLGSGVLSTDINALLHDEPAATMSIKAGAALTVFSGDKLLGGPQAGILVGTHAAIEKCRRHPLARAFRLGRLPLAALTATLKLYRDPDRALKEIPVLSMLTATPEELTERATRIAAATEGNIIEVSSKIGGGTLPLTELRGPAVAITSPHHTPNQLAQKLREQDPPLITRIIDDRVVLDPRTLHTEQDLQDAIATATKVLQP